MRKPLKKVVAIGFIIFGKKQKDGNRNEATYNLEFCHDNGNI